MANLLQLARARPMPLKCRGVGRDKHCKNALQFYFDRPVTDDEMRFLNEVMERTVACLPKAVTNRTDPEGGIPGRAN